MSMENKKKYYKWTQENLDNALLTYREGRMGLNECSRQFGISKPTLKRHFKNENKYANGNKTFKGHKTALPDNIEEDLVQHILYLEKHMFGLTITEIRKLAFEIVEKNKIKCNFNKDKKIAGKKWFYNFLRRHPDLSLRQPEATSLARVRGFNQKSVGEFFDLYEQIVEENNLSETRIFNADESGFSTVQKKTQKIVGQKGKRQIGGITSGERGVNTTIVCCASPSGFFLPPMVIFKRMRMHEALKKGAPPGSLVEVSETGYINSELFVKFLQHFIDHVHPTKEKKVLLLVDGHTTHSKNIKAIVLAKENGVILLQLPGHTTHRLQPLDVGFFCPLGKYYIQAQETWLKSHASQAITQFEISELLCTAYSQAATLSNAIGSFRGAGIWPINRFVFTDADFLPSEVHNNQNENECDFSETVVEHQEQGNTTPTHENNLSIEIENNHHDDTINDHYFSPTVLSPLPLVTKNTKKRGRPAQKATILTATPYKEDLEEKQSKRKFVKPKKVKCKLSNEPRPSTSRATEIEVNIDEWYCFLCDQNLIEDMVQCSKCRRWVHESCSGAIAEKVYACDECC
jgi:hypothetical protein